MNMCRIQDFWQKILHFIEYALAVSLLITKIFFWQVFLIPLSASWL